MFEPGVQTQPAIASSHLHALNLVLDEFTAATQSPGGTAGDGDFVVHLSTVIRRLEYVRAQAAARLHTSGAYADDGSRTAHAWIASRSTQGRGAARAMVRAGVWQRQHPLMAQAWAAGEIEAGHLRELTCIHERFPRLGPLLTEAESEITQLAQQLTPRTFASHLWVLCHRLDAQACDEDEHDRRGQDYLHVSTTLHGMVKIDGLLPAELGQQFRAALESARRTITEEPTPQPDPSVAADPGVPAIPDTGDRRKKSQKNLEALHRILNAAAAAETDGALPTINGSRPVVNVSIPLEALLSESSGKVVGILQRFGMPAAVTSSITSAATVERLTCDGHIQPYIVDTHGRLIASLPNIRSVSRNLRKAVHIRDQHCRFPGCDSRIDEAHHIIFARHQGPTSMNNLIGLCWHHHQHIHHGPWNITGDPNNTVTFTNTRTRKSWRSPPAQCRPTQVQLKC